jgi:release factor glutamine methyltransferase
MRAIDGLQEISAVLKEYGIEEPDKEAEVILTDCMEVDRVALYRDNPALSDLQMETMSKILERRRRREPLQYILGYADFCGLKINVGPGVLIPRPETELLLEEALRVVRLSSHPRLPLGKGRQRGDDYSPRIMRPAPRILDLCTGSGCLAIALAGELGHAEVFGTDLSEAALRRAMMNAATIGLRNITFLKGDLYEPVKGMRFEIIVSNPPYVKSADIAGLSPEVRVWEPLEALDGGEDGLDFYKRILSCSADYLAEQGSLILELGYGEVGDVIKIAERSGLSPDRVVRDHSGIERVLSLSLR